MKSLYETDFYQWTTETSRSIEQGKFDEVDWGNVVEEIEALGRKEKQELVNRLGILLGYLHQVAVPTIQSWQELVCHD